MKRLGLLILALCVAAGGCAKSASKKVQDPQASRLDNLEAGFARFQEQQRARDADIDLKLREIATSLDRLNAGKPPAPKSRKAKERVKEPASARTRQPIVAGQIIPYSQLVGQQGAPVQQPPAGAYPGQPAPGYAGQPAAGQAPAYPGQAAPASGRQPQPVAPQGSQGQPAPAYPGQPTPAYPGQSAPAQMQQGQPVRQPVPGSQGQPAQPVQAGVQPSQPYSQPSATGLKPPVVTLGDPYQGVQPTPPQRPAVPVDPKRGKGRASSRAPQPVEQASPAPASPPAASAPSAMAPAIPGAAPTPAAAPSPAPAAAPASGDMREMQLYTDALRSISANKSEDGRKKFNDFLAKYPSSPKAPEALYWIGESYMGDKSYNQAILSFKEVTGRFPKDQKAQEALFRTAEAYERLGDKANAAFQLKLLVDEHPNSEFAGKARQKLKQLGQ